MFYITITIIDDSEPTVKEFPAKFTKDTSVTISHSPENGFSVEKSNVSNKKLTARQKKTLDSTLFGRIRNDLIPYLDFSMFETLYSTSGRPAVEASTKLMLLIIKLIQGCSYRQFELRLEFDEALKYAVGVEYGSKPVSGRTLRDFLFRIAAYESEHGVNLLDEFFHKNSEIMARAIGADLSRIRLDSFMIEADLKKLSRQELIYRANLKAVKKLVKLSFDVPGELKCYLDDNFENKRFYHDRDKYDPDDLTETLLIEMLILIDAFPESLRDSEEYEILTTIFDEQARILDGKPQLKPAREVPSGAAQSPADMTATFVRKAGKGHIGFKGTEADATNGQETIIVNSQTDKNNVSDSEILKRVIPELPAQEQKTELLTDGAYGSLENKELARDHNIDHRTTNLPGKPTEAIHHEFTLDETGKKVEFCPAGHSPKTSCFNEKTEAIFFSMDKQVCDGCPRRDECIVAANPKARKPRTLRGRTSRTSVWRATLEKEDQSEEARQRRIKDAHFRNGSEAVISDLKHNSGLDRKGPQLRGLGRVRIENLLASISHNVRSCVRYFNRTGESGETAFKNASIN